MMNGVRHNALGVTARSGRPSVLDLSYPWISRRIKRIPRSISSPDSWREKCNKCAMVEVGETVADLPYRNEGLLGWCGRVAGEVPFPRPSIFPFSALAGACPNPPPQHPTPPASPRKEGEFPSSPTCRLHLHTFTSTAAVGKFRVPRLASIARTVQSS